MFFGEYVHQIDDNGRIRIPSLFKEELGVEYFITVSLDCLVVMNKSRYEFIFEKRFDNIDPISQKNKAAAIRLWYSKTVVVQEDKHGRVVIPFNFRQKLNLQKDIVINGVGKWIEIWDSSKWEQYNKDNPQDEVFDLFDSVNE